MKDSVWRSTGGHICVSWLHASCVADLGDSFKHVAHISSSVCEAKRFFSVCVYVCFRCKRMHILLSSVFILQFVLLLSPYRCLFPTLCLPSLCVLPNRLNLLMDPTRNWGLKFLFTNKQISLCVWVTSALLPLPGLWRRKKCRNETKEACSSMTPKCNPGAFVMIWESKYYFLVEQWFPF